MIKEKKCIINIKIDWKITIFRILEVKSLNERPEWLAEIVNLPDVNANIKSFGGHKQWVPFGWKAEPETHFAFEIMLIISGVQETVFDGMTYQFEENDIALITPGLRHENACISKEGMEYFCVHFDIDDPEIQQQLLMYCPIQFQRENPQYEKIANILLEYVSLLNQATFTIKDKLRVEMLLLDLVNSLLEYAEAEQIKIDHSDNNSLILAKSIAENIQRNFRKFTEYPTEEHRYLLTMDYVAESLIISKSSMLKSFKKVYGMSPKQYLDQLKYNEAKFLLHQPKLSVHEIAEIIGYQNASHFTRQFKTWSGMSPKDYRKVAEN